MSERERGPRPETRSVEVITESISTTERLQRLEKIVQDPEVYKGFVALLRTGINLGISAADTMPGGAGEIGSWTADGCKLLAARFSIPMLDTSPDVSKLVAIGSEITEPVTGGAMPSHLIETSLQLRADWPRIKQALIKTRDIWRGTQDRLQDTEVQEAIKTFTK
ncbi:hypothetical protein KBC55_00190 [Patescibacteria group bacterium]|nr:hypothetical protein [Patescibacteria group bacterium]